MGTPEDVANLVAYLASEEANFMTGMFVTALNTQLILVSGQTICLNGGSHMD